MKVVKQFSKLTPNHTGLVFFDESSARSNQLINTVGRYDPNNGEFILLNDESPAVLKLKSLINKIYTEIVSIGNGKYFINFDASRINKSIENDSISESVIKSEIDLMNSLAESDKRIRKVLYRDCYVGTLENDDFYLDDQFADAEGHYFDFYESHGSDDVLIDDVKSTGIDILNIVIDKINKAKIEADIKNDKQIKESALDHLDHWYGDLSSAEREEKAMAIIKNRESTDLVNNALKWV